MWTTVSSVMLRRCPLYMFAPTRICPFDHRFLGANDHFKWILGLPPTTRIFWFIYILSSLCASQHGGYIARNAYYKMHSYNLGSLTSYIDFGGHCVLRTAMKTLAAWIKLIPSSAIFYSIYTGTHVHRLLLVWLHHFVQIVLNWFIPYHACPMCKTTI